MTRKDSRRLSLLGMMSIHPQPFPKLLFPPLHTPDNTPPPGKAPPTNLKTLLKISAAAFWGFSRGGFPENACIEGAISERNFCEICRRKSPQNTEKHKTKLCAEVPERPLPKDPLVQLLKISQSNWKKNAANGSLAKSFWCCGSRKVHFCRGCVNFHETELLSWICFPCCRRPRVPQGKELETISDPPGKTSLFV